MSRVEQEFAMRTEMGLQFRIIKDCFNDCVQSFKEQSLTQREQSCVKNCALREAGAANTFADLSSTIMQRSSGMGGGSRF